MALERESSNGEYVNPLGSRACRADSRRFHFNGDHFEKISTSVQAPNGRIAQGSCLVYASRVVCGERCKEKRFWII